LSVAEAKTIEDLLQVARARLDRVDPAAAILRDLGFALATDLVGGFNAWASAGLPVAQLLAD